MRYPFVCTKVLQKTDIFSKDEALRYVKDFFNREADKIDQKYNDPNDEDKTIRYDP